MFNFFKRCFSAFNRENCRACTDCAHAKENKKPCKQLKGKYSMDKWVFRFITVLCIVGLIVPLAAQFFAPIPDQYQVALDVWNSYVSIILGVVATLLSIVSLVFSFHNEEEENIQQRDYDKQFEHIKSALQEIGTSVADTKADVDKMNERIIQISMAVSGIKDNLNIKTVESTTTTDTIEASSME